MEIIKELIKKGKFRLDKVEYSDGIGCCVWTPMDDDSEDCGICFDFDFEDIDSLIQIIKEAKTLTPEKYVEKKEDKKPSFFKRLNRLKYIEIKFSPFYWGFRWNSTLRSFRLGPFKFNWV